jgi:hypothetical protein
MRKRIAAVFAVLTVALVPAFAGATEVPAGGTAPVVLVKASPATIVEVTPESMVLDVADGYEWLDGTEEKVPATGIKGQRITVGLGEKSIVRRGDEAVGRDALKAGLVIKALLQTDGQPVTPTCTFTLVEAYLDGPPKVHPGDKFETGFFHRLWHVRGSILGLDAVEGRNVMNVDVRRLENAPKRFRDEGSRLARMDAYVIVPPRVVITDENGHRIAFSGPDVDDRVKVVVKTLPKSKWMVDESGEPTPTLLAKRIKVKASS